MFFNIQIDLIILKTDDAQFNNQKNRCISPLTAKGTGSNGHKLCMELIAQQITATVRQCLLAVTAVFF